jgi:hypothetical protein
VNEIIPQQIAHDNNYFSLAARSIHLLPAIGLKLLRLFYEDRLLGAEKSNRSLKELAQRFGVRPDYISKQLCHLHELGFLDGDPHGRSFKRRWITYEAFYQLDVLSTNQCTNQISPILIRSLQDLDKRSILDIEEQQNSGQLPIEDEIIDIDTLNNNLLNSTFEQIKMPYHARTTIKNTLSRSQLASGETFYLLERVSRGSRQNSIKAPLAYFLKSIQNEEKRIRL